MPKFHDRRRTICILGPSPGTNGGIGMMMSYLSRTDSNATILDFVCSGGSPGSALSRLTAFARAALYVWLSRNRVDFFHLNTSSGASAYRKLVLSLLIRAVRGNYVVHLHSGGFPNFYSRSPRLFRAAIRAMFRNASGVIVLGTFWRSWVHEHLGIPLDCLHILPNAVPQSITARIPGLESRRSVKFLFVGRVEPAKGVLELLNAWKLANVDGRFELLIAGNVDRQHGSIAQTIEDMKPFRVSHYGWLSPSELSDVYRNADVIILPSHFENMPIVLLEGMSWGLVPVATPVGAVPDIVNNGTNGFLVPLKDASALSLTLSKLMNDPELVESLSIEAFKTWRNKFDLSQYRDRFDLIYDGLNTSNV